MTERKNCERTQALPHLSTHSHTQTFSILDALESETHTHAHTHARTHTHTHKPNRDTRAKHYN